MFGIKNLIFLALVLVAQSCDDDSDKNDNNGSDQGDDGLGEGNSAGKDDDDSCEIVATTDVTWSEHSALGTPQEAFSAMAETCDAPFSWDGSGWDSLKIEPCCVHEHCGVSCARSRKGNRIRPEKKECLGTSSLRDAHFRNATFDFDVKQ